MSRLRKLFWVGLGSRFLCVPFLMQWFHPDERQMLEFAHFHAHGRLHPFLESELHLRNQTLPWFFSWLIRFLDQLGLSTPWIYLIGIQLLIALWSWLGFWTLLIVFEETGHRLIGGGGRTDPMSGPLRTWFGILGWFFALFWGFAFLYSRPLLEVVSFPPACFLLLAVSRGLWFQAGFWAGIAGIFRYPSALWGLGALLYAWSDSRKPRVTWAWGILGLLLAIVLGGFADLETYGHFLESAKAYWAFNRPGGPVRQMFGDDSLWVYWKWFAYFFSPWLAPLFLGAAAYALIRVPKILFFCLPYILGHLYTPHREPRFMLPLTPFLVLAIALALARDWGRIRELQMVQVMRSKRWVARAALGFVGGHLFLNFVFFPLNAWAQWQSAQGVLLRFYSHLNAAPPSSALITLADPLIDVQVPMKMNWGDRDCRWHRPGPASESPLSSGVFWLLAREKIESSECKPLDLGGMDNLKWESSPTWAERIFRVRLAHLWECSKRDSKDNGATSVNGFLKKICPSGWAEVPAGQPWISDHL